MLFIKYLLFFFSFSCIFTQQKEVLNPFSLNKVSLLKIEEPKIRARSAIVIDMNTNYILYQKNPTLIIPAASLTKLVSIYTALLEAKNKNINFDDEITFSKNAWYTSSPKGSSVMFLGADQIATFKDILLGISVSSGNDAAIALSEIISDNTNEFVKKMNNYIDNLDLSVMNFVEPSGYDERNIITAKEYIRFLITYLKTFPWVTEKLHSIKTFAYPKKKNLVYKNTKSDPIEQENRNGLLFSRNDVDGLKTGYIDESGYNIAISSKKNGMHILVVVLGVIADKDEDGSKLREADASTLLDYAYDNFLEYTLSFPKELNKEQLKVNVWKGKEEEFFILKPENDILTIPKEYTKNLATVKINYAKEIFAPIKKNIPVGKVTYYIANKEIKSTYLYPDRDIEESDNNKKFFDSFKLFFYRIFYKIKNPLSQLDQYKLKLQSKE